jgi:exopolyphosphatase/guanosine-5'-triphosphate,3'-diphosphate pyrophosphatase
VRVAAVDIGTNSTNLLIVDEQGREITREIGITRLGAGVDRHGVLAEDAIERTVAQLQHYRELLGAHEVQHVRAVATSASRDAANREDFFDRAEAVLGVRPGLISGEQEGALAYRGAVGDRPAGEYRLVVDIGGGSTEFMLGDDELRGVTSIDVGSVRLTEAYLHGDPPRPEELTNAIGAVQDLLEDVERELPGIAARPMLLGIAGTITTIAAVEIGLPVYDPTRVHGATLSRPAIEEVFRTLATEPLADRIHNPGLPRERADVIVGGCCVLVAVMRTWHVDELVVSNRTLLDGVCRELLDEFGAVR